MMMMIRDVLIVTGSMAIDWDVQVVLCIALLLACDSGVYVSTLFSRLDFSKV